MIASLGDESIAGLSRETLPSQEIVQRAAIVVGHSSDVARGGWDDAALEGRRDDGLAAHLALGEELGAHLLRAEVSLGVVPRVDLDPTTHFVNESVDCLDHFVARLRLARGKDEAFGVERAFLGKSHHDRRRRAVGGWDVDRLDRGGLGTRLAHGRRHLGGDRLGHGVCSLLGSVAREEERQGAGKVLAHGMAPSAAPSWGAPWGGAC